MARTPQRARAIPPLLKDLNERTVLETIRVAAPISRAEISRRAGISKPTVSLALQSLLDAGLVREVEHDPGRPSYGAVFFEPVPEAALVLGLDLGARFLRGAICDLRGELRAREDVELRRKEFGYVVDALAALRESLYDETGLPDAPIDTTVVGVPGVVEQDTGKVFLTHFTALEGRALGPALEERLGLELTLDNDVNLAAVGEHWRGVARDVDDFVFLSIGTGLGAGIVLQGELHRGRNGAAGELDLVAAGFDREIDPSAAAVSELARVAAQTAARDTSMVPPFEAREIFLAARDGDRAAQAVVEEVAKRIALHIVPVAAVTDVELVVLGGGLGTNGDLLLEPVRGLLAEWLPYPPQVEVSSLGEAAVLTGALAVGLRSALDNVFVNRPRAARA
jgi:predicted NBD/HSP70 family sugar kinase